MGGLSSNMPPAYRLEWGCDDVSAAAVAFHQQGSAVGTADWVTHRTDLRGPYAPHLAPGAKASRTDACKPLGTETKPAQLGRWGNSPARARHSDRAGHLVEHVVDDCGTYGPVGFLAEAATALDAMVASGSKLHIGPRMVLFLAE